ncbi:hypothetical protein K438DRAFT_1993913 [Mycena galopus ATCC 62051]|nr:hypothetical protein K438DRAFT_1993913 [Mycena galopus ATCC 62051]
MPRSPPFSPIAPTCDANPSYAESTRRASIIDTSTATNRDPIRIQEGAMELSHAPLDAVPAAVKDPPCNFVEKSTVEVGGRTNVACSSAGQPWMRENQDRTLAVDFQKLVLSPSPPLNIRTDVEFGQRNNENSIGSGDYNVLPPSPAPVLAVCGRTVELGGQIVDQHCTDSDVKLRTLRILDDATSHEPMIPAYLSLGAHLAFSLISPLPVLSAVMVYKAFALISAIVRTFQYSHLGSLVVGDTGSCLKWGREGIGTHALN